MNWGAGIAWVIVLFAGLMICLVVYSFRQELNLVSKDYYNREILYQQQIDKIANTKSLRERPLISYRADDRILKVRFPESLMRKNIDGKVELYRPSDSRLDKYYPVDLDERGEQYINLSALLRGRWIVKLTWNDPEQGYYDELQIFIR